MSALPQVIALYSSQPQQGKSTIAHTLVARHGFALVKFADPLKRQLRTLFREYGMDPYQIHNYIEGPLKDSPVPGFEGATARELMVSLGTDWGRRMVSKDIWVRPAIRRVMDKLTNWGCSVVIDDMRFPNEYKAIQHLPWAGRVRTVKVVALETDAAPTLIQVSETEGLLNRYIFNNEIFADRGDLKRLYHAADYLAQPPA